MASRIKKTKEDMFHEVFTSMGGTMVEVELGDNDYELALDEALRVYRANSQNSIIFGWLSLDLSIGKQHYQLPDWVDEVQDLKRLRSGLLVGMPYEPFSISFLQATFGQLSAGSADLVTFEAMADYQELLGRMFGEFITYTFNRTTKELFIHKLPRGPEKLGVEVSTTRSLQALLNDTTSYRWLRTYTEAHACKILGEGYSKYQGGVIGPQGVQALKGQQLLQQSTTMKAALMTEIVQFQDGGDPPMPIIA